MIRALIYLQARSLVNRLRVRLRRLKEPKYLIGGLVGFAYCFAFVFRNLAMGRLPVPEAGPWTEPAADLRVLLELAGAGFLLAILAAFWIVPSRRASLDFSEAEIQFLFTAPVSRRGLLHYKLIGGQVGLLFTSVVVSFFSGRLFRADGAWMSVFGWWLALLVVQLHVLGASFVRTWLLDRGSPNWPRRVGVAGLLVVLGLTALLVLRGELPPLPGQLELPEVRQWAERVAQTPPLVWVLTPLRWVARLTLTRSPAEFAFAALPVVALAVIHYAWVVRANIAFEEAAVEAARAAAGRNGAGRRGELRRPTRPAGRRRQPFRLRPVGPVWVALGWKNLIAAGAVSRGTAWVLGLAVAVPLVAVVATAGWGKMWAAVVGSMALMLLVLSVLFGPGAARFDLRQDLMPAGELLKALPLAGWQVVLGELLAPWGMLAVVQWGLALVAFGLLPEESRMVGSGWGTRAILFGAAALLAPSLSLVGLGLQNGAVLWFPAWILAPRDQPRGGFEAMGQQIIVFVGHLVVFTGALVPAVLAGGVAFALLSWGIGPWLAVLPAAAVTGTVLLGESALLLMFLGRCWDRFDLSRETIR